MYEKLNASQNISMSILVSIMNLPSAKFEWNSFKFPEIVQEKVNFFFNYFLLNYFLNYLFTTFLNFDEFRSIFEISTFKHFEVHSVFYTIWNTSKTEEKEKIVVVASMK